MAAKKSKENPHQWADGTWHSNTEAEHRAAEALKAAHAVGDAQTQAVFGNWKPGMTVAQAQALANAVPGAPQPASSTPAGAAAPAVKRIDPFFTPDDVLSRDDWYRNIHDQGAIGESTLANARTDTALQSGQLAAQAVKATADTTDNMIERGLFQSSIKDAALDDITATRTTQQGYLDARLKTAESDHDTWVAKYGGVLSDGVTKVDVGTEVAKFEQNWAGKAAANAKAVNDLLPAPPEVAPAPVAAPPVPAPAKPITAPAAPRTNLPVNQASGSGTTASGAHGTASNGSADPASTGFQEIPGVNGKGVAGTWHVYPNGRRVFVPTGGMTP